MQNAKCYIQCKYLLLIQDDGWTMCKSQETECYIFHSNSNSAALNT